jgi:isocitrate dehydrogenase (NAD+)
MAHNETVPHQVTLIPGDGIGPEVAKATVRAVEATGARINWHPVELSAKVIEDSGHEIPQHVIDSLHETRTGLKGPITTPVAGGHVSLNVQLRRKFDLFANFRPVKSFPGIRTRYNDVFIDLAIFRENTEDLYSGIEHEVVTDVVTSLKVITRHASERIARHAFAWARRNRRQKVTAVHKANIMKLGDGLFLRCCREVAKEFPDIAYKELIVDNTAMQMVIRPETFDVLVMPNLYGDIISDLAAGLVGGLGIVPGANLGIEHAIFEAVHGSAPDIAGKNLANPTALMQSAALMLNHLGEPEAAKQLQAAIEWVYAEGRHLTPDVGGTGTTTEFADAVVRRLESRRQGSAAQG